MTKILSFILAVIVIFMFIPQVAAAGETPEPAESNITSTTAGSQTTVTGNVTEVVPGEQPTQLPASEVRSIPEKRAALLAEGAREEIAERNAYCEVFQKTDGTKTAIISSAPINYKAEDGSYQPIDNSLIPGSEPGTLVNKSNSFSVKFFEKHGNGNILIKTTSGKEILINQEVKLQSLNQENLIELLQKANESQASVNNHTLTYKELFPGIDEEYLVQSSGVKHNYIINRPLPGLEKKAGEQLAFTEEIVLPEGSRLSVENKIQAGNFETDKDIVLLDAAGEMTGVFARPIAYDSRTELPDPEISDLLDLTYHVEFVRENIVQMSVLVPVDWLNDAKRMYPVTVDPWFYESYGYDDGFQYDWYNMDYSSTYMPVGQGYYGYPFYIAYMMWRGIPIPRYSTINYVTYFYTPFLNYSYDNNCSWEWRFEYTGNALPCAYQLPVNRTYSYWSNSWINYNNPWTAGSLMGFGLGDNGRIALQEIVNRYDWNPGNSIGLKWCMYPSYPNNYRLIFSRDVSDYYAPQLYIDYVVPPLPPTGVTATDGLFTDIVTINWSWSSGATDYKIYRNTENNQYGASYIGGTDGLAFNDNNAELGNLYYYWVKAHNAAGDSDFSFHDIGWVAVAAPMNVAASDGTYTNKVLITWSGSYGATGYKVLRNTECNCYTAAQIGTTYLLGYEDTSASTGLQYFYWVRAYNGQGDSAFSNYNTGWRAGDDAVNDVGAFWVSNYIEYQDLLNSNATASGFINTLTGIGWNQAFYKGDEGQVIEADFQETAEINTSPDGVDIFWFQGHGSAGALLLKNDFYGTDRVCYNEVEWGDRDVEWVFLHACLTLQDDDTGFGSETPGLKTNGKFAQALNGCHMILGAGSVMFDDSTQEGQNVATRLVDSDGGGPDEAMKVVNAWIEGIDITNDSRVILRIVTEDKSYWDDFIWGQGTGPVSDVSIDNYYYSISHQCLN